MIVDVTGKNVLTFDPQNEIDRRVVKQISAVFDEVTRRMNAPDSPIQNIVRINEASSRFEDMFREVLNAMPGFSCDFPRTAKGRGNPRVIPICAWSILRAAACFILIRKLYETGSRASSFRIFYSEQKIATNKARRQRRQFYHRVWSTSRAKKTATEILRWTLSILRVSK